MQTIAKTCQHCSRGFEAARKGRRFCSHACYADSRAGIAGPGSFAAGCVPLNKVPVGTVRIRERRNRKGERRAFIKVAEPNVWELRAHVVWIEARGPIPAGAHVHHANRDKTDDRIENLELLTPQEHSAEHTADRHNEAARQGILAAWARRRETRACQRCGRSFVGVLGRPQPACPACRKRDAQAKYKAKMRDHAPPKSRV